MNGNCSHRGFAGRRRQNGTACRMTHLRCIGLPVRQFDIVLGRALLLLAMRGRCRDSELARFDRGGDVVGITHVRAIAR